jgi:M61 glycyl aminopeptidase
MWGIGQLRQHQAASGGAQLAISLVGVPRAAPSAPYAQWMSAIVGTMAQQFGHFPVPAAQILIVLQPASSEPVPWGEVLRAGADGLLLYVDGSRPLTVLAADWVAFHEFSHFLHPYLPRRDSWWAEGLASYYQNVLRARAGYLTGDAAWRALHAGFARGLREVDGQTSLAQASSEMTASRKFMRVYWSGAAIALLADVELRLRTRNQTSLSSVLAQFADCCLSAAREWTAQEFMQRLDELAGVPVFVPLLTRYVAAVAFPDLAPAYAVLGLRATGTRLEFLEGGAEQRLRAAIMPGK